MRSRTIDNEDQARLVDAERRKAEIERELATDRWRDRPAGVDAVTD